MQPISKPLPPKSLRTINLRLKPDAHLSIRCVTQMDQEIEGDKPGDSIILRIALYYQNAMHKRFEVELDNCLPVDQLNPHHTINIRDLLSQGNVRVAFSYILANHLVNDGVQVAVKYRTYPVHDEDPSDEAGFNNFAADKGQVSFLLSIDNFSANISVARSDVEEYFQF